MTLCTLKFIPKAPDAPTITRTEIKIPLCLIIGASMRRVASGNTFVSLGEEFHIGGSTLRSFDKKFWKWFRKEYWSTWSGGVSGVGFDDIASIEKEEKLFRQMVLPGFITCMDDVHYTAPGWIKYATTIFADTTNYKTIVRSDELNGCMALCDGGYHNWLETMSGMNNATNAIETRWTDRYTVSHLIPKACV
jgi:hypothetical protein